MSGIIPTECETQRDGRGHIVRCRDLGVRSFPPRSKGRDGPLGPDRILGSTPIAGEQGIALISTLCLMVLGLGMVVVLYYTVTQGVKVTSSAGRYAVALDAAKGGGESLIMMIQEGVMSPDILTMDGLIIFGRSGSACLQDKCEKESSQANWTNCTSYDNATNPDPTISADLFFSLNNPVYNVSAKIIDTKMTGDYYFYTIVARAQSANSNDRADVQVLYRLER
jgi:hypothetical protein